MKKILLSTLLLAVQLFASAFEAKVDGIWYDLNPVEQVAQVTYQHYRLEGGDWFTDYRFASERNSTGDERFVIPMDLWERLKTETFYVTISGANPSIRVQDGWWSTIWTNKAIEPGNENIMDNGDGTWTLTINLAGDPLLNTMDEKHLQFVGTGFSLEDIYLLDSNVGAGYEKVFVWKNGIGLFELETVNIPEKFNYDGVEYIVTSIGNNAFRDCNSLNSATIPNSVTSIGSNAFAGCRSLTSLTIPNSVISIGRYAFASTGWYEKQNDGLLYLDDVLLGYKGNTPEGDITISQGTRVIAEMTFAYCNGLTSITIPNSVTNIGDGAFTQCRGLTSITIPNSVNNIGKEAFSDCNGLTSVTIPNSVTTIGEYAFRNCNNITSVSIPNSVVSIGDDAFQGCYSLNSVNITDIGAWCSISFGSVSSNPLCYGYNGCKLFLNGEEVKDLVIPNSVTSIGDYAFDNCRNLTSVDIPNSVISIGEAAFRSCFNLTSVTIPNSVATIGSEAFRECYGLTSLIIPNSVISIGNYAFLHCQRLASITVEGGGTKYDSRDDCNAIIETETNTLIAGCKNTVIPNTVTSIGDGAFGGRQELTSITIPNSVTSIGEAAFYSCNLTSVVIPNSVRSIGFQAFAWNWGLTSLTIGNSVTSIGDYAFEGCQNLNSVTIPNSVTNIGNYAFSGCSLLAEVRSMITEPFEIDDYVFGYWNWDYETSTSTFYYPSTLYVPAGTKEKYESTAGWNKFKNIVEMDIVPIENGETIDIGTEIDENTNLDGTVVDNVFVKISNGDGGFDPVEKCIIVSKPTEDSAINGKDIFGDDFKDNYTGIVFKVNEGKGSIKVEAETQGNMVLKVKIGNGDPIEMELDGKLKVTFPYNVSEETLVYIYGGMSAAGAKASGVKHAPSAADALKIYSIQVDSNATGIDMVDGEASSVDTPVYNLNGQRVSTPTKGIFIRNGRKVLVK